MKKMMLVVALMICTNTWSTSITEQTKTAYCEGLWSAHQELTAKLRQDDEYRKNHRYGIISPGYRQSYLKKLKAATASFNVTCVGVKRSR